MSGNHILKNLRSLIRNATLKYNGEFVWQDVELTQEFKNAYSEYLENNKYSIEFFDSTAVITTSGSKYIYVPNQWFVIASYTVSVYKELENYKEYFKDICEELNEVPSKYAKQLRDSATVVDKNTFLQAAGIVLRRRNRRASDEQIKEAQDRLWRFVNDYSWWSGQKTIDRGDFYVSVILNMLNLVNASQGYVADIVNAYARDYRLGLMVRELDGFTVNMTCNIEDKAVSKINLYEEEQDAMTANYVAEAQAIYGENPENGHARIKLKSINNKEIKYKK